MAYIDSDQIANNSNYALGDYSFRIERSSVPGSSNDKIEAICTDKDGKNARKSIQVLSSTQLDGWYVEANETEATVYATVKVQTGGTEYSSDLDIPGVKQPIATGGFYESYAHYWGEGYPTNPRTKMTLSGIGTMRVILGQLSDSPIIRGVVASEVYDGPSSITVEYSTNIISGEMGILSVVKPTLQFTHNGKTVYYGTINTGDDGWVTVSKAGAIELDEDIISVAEKVAWTIVYGTPSGGEYETKSMLIGRFAIELEDAGGVGPGSDWTDPEDYDEDWEEGDPTHTLYVEVTGALSGRHNDPIVDPSYSYIPADKDTMKDYGCGGDGGHGGGGGAGASTVVVHKFATNQANSKEVTALARRHGYGSGGGKGGKGGDGCILVYY